VNKTDSNRQNDTRDLPTEPAGTVQEASEIPKFDLAEQILAEQRKITAIRRKAPGKKNESPAQGREVESIGYTIKQPPLTLSEQGRIIAEIVARDIEKLRRGDTSSLRRPDFTPPIGWAGFRATNINPE